ncbi:DUF1822 family protein [Microcoleus sp. herbarium19]|uniref:DUF1822 family protein n=1 Tax=unclassified Microcoleus TaxID=2642155 RepID=UPI002FD7551E
MNHNHLSEIDYLPMPITQKARQLAEQFASQQRHPQRHEQVYFNTLAVLAVRDYLKIIDIETDLTQCDSWNPIIRLFSDVADLYIKGLGKVECRPVKSRQQNQEDGSRNSPARLPEICPVPLEARAERIGYIAVEIDEEQKEARLLGFSPTADAGELVLSELHSLDDFLTHLEDLSESKVDLSRWLANVFKPDWQPFETVFEPQVQTPTPEIIENPIPSQLGNWFKNFVEAGWQKFEQGKQNLESAIFPDDNAGLVFRGGANLNSENTLRGHQSSVKIFPEADVTRAKLIDLGLRLGRTTVALLVAVAQQSDRTLKVCVQLHPALREPYLPRNLKLSLISDAGEVLGEVKSTVQYQCILLPEFYVEPAESFSIRVAIGDLSITENFVV